MATRLDPAIAPVRVDPGGIEQVLVNLVVNAQDAMPRGGRLRIEMANGAPGASWRPGSPPTHAVLTVSDTGEGMTPGTLTQAFEPFFTTKPVGTGLGLASVYGIVQRARGVVLVESRPGEGATFHVYLPRVSVEGLENDRGPGNPAETPGSSMTDSRAGDDVAGRPQ